ncbi:MAG: hypothetical protein KJZ78_21445 [Bryobacteraceae bacterium]|nr:hypothetical protein [Bryobacteraceae bacterium]
MLSRTQLELHHAVAGSSDPVGPQLDWTGEILVPRGKLYGCRLLPDDEPVLVGRTENWSTLPVGLWAFHHRINTDARFPQVEGSFPRGEHHRPL